MGIDGALSRLFEPGDSVSEDLNTLAVTAETESGPLGVLSGEEEAFGVGHEAEDASGCIGKPGDIGERAVGIFGFGEEIDAGGVAGGCSESGGVRRPVAEGDLAIFAQFVEYGGVLDSDSAFGMRDGNVKFVHTSKEDAVVGGYFEADPAVSVATVAIPCESQSGFERRWGRGIDTSAGEQAGFENGLEAVANSEYESIAAEEIADAVVELSAELAGEDHAGAEVVTVAESAGDAENLVVCQQVWRFEESEEVHAVSNSAGNFEGMRCFDITVGSWCPKHTNTGLHHLYPASQRVIGKKAKMLGLYRESVRNARFGSGILGSGRKRRKSWGVT